MEEVYDNSYFDYRLSARQCLHDEHFVVGFQGVLQAFFVPDEDIVDEDVDVLAKNALFVDEVISKAGVALFELIEEICHLFRSELIGFEVREKTLQDGGKLYAGHDLGALGESNQYTKTLTTKEPEPASFLHILVSQTLYLPAWISQFYLPAPASSACLR
jgi:hypothetical protein